MWKVGELAAEAGLTVRTLHHYDRLGLVRPATRTGAGHRLYSDADVQRLYQVLALRRLGLGLDRIGEVLAGGVPMAQVLAAHRDCLAVRLDAMRDLYTLVTALAATAESRPDLRSDHFLDLIRRTAMIDDTIDNHFTRDNAEAFAALYFAQLTARQGALRFWYAADAVLTLDDSAYVGPPAIIDRLGRLPRAGYAVNAVEVQPDTITSTVFRVSGGLVRKPAEDVHAFETSFTLTRPSVNNAYMITDQTFRSVAAA
ncbi:MerR family transcriptional regulator [Nocardia sp. NPDC005978]|uniref:MerR family transcriptional regulator n=1 Tax=Nocardia sp. NPDC005978 TaxID=3156725 RepID=UPI0033BB85C0